MNTMLANLVKSSNRLTPNGIKLSDFINRDSYRGLFRLWFFDVGSVSFLFTSLLGFGIAALSLYIDKTSSIGLVLSMSVISSSMSVLWQLNRLVGAETSGLIPGYQRNVVVQSIVIYFSVMLFSLGFAVIFAPQTVTSVLLAVLISLGFLWGCLHWNKGFQFSILLFIAMPFFDQMTLNVPWWCLVIPLGILLELVKVKLGQLTWHQDARATYLSGMEMGWFWLPSMKQHNLLDKLNRYLHPASFFVGPLLAMALVMVTLFGLILLMPSTLFEWHLPVQLIIGQLLLMMCCLVHWSRVQRWRGAETLFMLPGFTGLTGLQQSFYKASVRLITLLVLSMLLICIAGYLMGQQLSLPFIIHLLLSVLWSGLFALGLGALSRNISQMSATMLVIISHSLFVSFSFKALQVQQDMDIWLIADVALTAAGVCLFIWSKNRLWKNSVIDL
ncbi:MULTISPECIES: hypothetical protein [Pseudomonadati]|uniref:ABC transporter permease n=1 Tax=Shewanella aestuarii TaxID=1028752 RepID=A0ABT0L2D8_9GAMM|nr:hypothetical protein [Shewanella aestuarii]MCL1117891.1 hypothetical protein [Shewanella aestuarii]GGN78779.1 ABC transporter permease [Shewanella aestuarii]